MSGTPRHTAMAVALAGVLTWSAGSAAAQGTRAPAPWRPAVPDSLSAFAKQARELLAQSRGAALSDSDRRAYALVDRIARAHFARLGPKGMRAAESLYPMLDSLGLSARLSQDPRLPTFAVVLYDNPHFDNNASLAYLYWFLGNEVRSQPINLKGGTDPKLRVVWRNDPQYPYDAGIVHTLGTARDPDPQLMVFRMLNTGLAWIPVQVGEDEIDLGGIGNAEWTDLDQDGVAELVSWTRGANDPLFGECADSPCPYVLTQRVFVHLRRGFELLEQRSLATPYATFVLFVRALSRGDEAFARTLTTRPEVVTAARELGWVGLTRAGAFRPHAVANDLRWPDRLRFDYGAAGRYGAVVEVRFANLQGHWLLEEILTLRRAEGAAPVEGTTTGTRPNAPRGAAGGTSGSTR